MHTLTRFAPVFALLASTALVACDKGEDNKNLVGTTGRVGVGVGVRVGGRRVDGG
jgi:hypothetical protein